MFRTLLFKELREQQRTFRLWIMAGVLLVSGLISPLIARYTPLLMSSIPGVPPSFAAMIPDPTILDSFTQYVKNVSQFGLIVAIVLTMGLVAQEIERGTAAMLLVKPVKRGAVILSKWLAGVISILFGLLLAGIGFAFYTLVLFGGFSLPNFLLLNGLMALFIIFYMTIALLASTLARSQGIAAAIAFGALLLLLIFDSLPVIGDYLPGELLNWGGRLFTPTAQSAWPALLASVGLIALFLGVAIFRFSREEI
jgi:ABC-2 type transport system permease protein